MIDIWALGILLYELIYGRAPFQGNSINDVRRKIYRNNIKFDEKFSEESRDLIKSILKINPNDKLTCFIYAQRQVCYNF